MTKRTCDVAGCERPHDSHGYCGMHYWRVKLTGEPGQVLPLRMKRGLECSVAECVKPVSGRTFCPMHYARWRKYGDPLGGRVFKNSYLTEDEWYARHTERAESGCLLWTAGLHSSGYGYVNFGTGFLLVHRWAFERFVGPIPEGFTVDHTCHNGDLSCPGGPKCLHRRCSEPTHLEAVTSADNVRRAQTRRRRRFREAL